MDQKKKQVLFGAVLAGIAVVMTELYVSSEVDRWKPKDLIDVTVASKPIPSGTVLTPSLVKKVTIPKQYAPVTAIPSSQIDQFFGQNLAQDIIPDDYILEGSFGVRRSVAEYLSEQIQGDNVRAITIPVTETSSLAGSIRAGDLVDVVYTFQVPEVNTQMTTLLLQNILVVATGGYSPEDVEMDSSSKGYSSVTLQASIADAMKLKYAEKNGTIDLLLRRRSDSSLAQLTSIAKVQEILGTDDAKKINQIEESSKPSAEDQEAFKSALQGQLKNYEGLSKVISR